MKHSCRAANFKVVLENDHIRQQAQELVDAFEESAAEDRRGTRLRESTFLDPLPSLNRTSKPLKILTLDDACLRALIAHMNHAAGKEVFVDVRESRWTPGVQQVTGRAFKCPRIFCGGVSFRSASDSPRDSNLIFHSSTTSSSSAGRILQIFNYPIWDGTGKLTESTYLYVAPLEKLTSEDAARDPFRSYAYVGGELYYDRYQPGVIITPDDIVSHFARTPMELPAIPYPCIHVLSLDKVWVLLAIFACYTLLTLFMQSVRLFSRDTKLDSEAADEQEDVVMEDIIELGEL